MLHKLKSSFAVTRASE